VLTVTDDDEEMYDDEYDDDMGYESEDREVDVSDRDDDDDLDGMGPIEGLSGDPNVIEIEMEDGDDVDEMDEDDEEDESDEDEDSDDMDDAEDRIEIVDDEGNPLEDDGASDWESEPEDVGDEEAEIDYEAAAQDLQEAGMHDLDDVDGLGRFGNIMRAIGEAGDFAPISVEDINQLNDHFIAEEDEDGKPS
jgi:E3 ubiquitin-protein ligase HUWE1